jgi:3'-5' exoribonuclease Rv2179c-like domain
MTTKIMRYHYDWEFKENGSTIEPISLGMVSDDNRELYIIYPPTIRAIEDRLYFGSADETDVWLRDNVLNHISDSDIDEYGCHNRQTFSKLVYNFMVNDLDWSHNWDIELWGYFGAYDHVCLSQLFGRMIDLPPPMPMYTNELMTIRNGRSKPPRPTDLPLHSALADAKYQKTIYDAWSKDVPQ